MTSIAETAHGQFVPEDQDARCRVAEEIGTTMLVEAGAGSGKTTLMIRRMVTLILSGVPVDRIAAVTFTRKAASELRERFEVELDTVIQTAGAAGGEDAGRASRAERARRDIDRGFVGTIHAFCGRLLREHALAVAVPPDFEEVEEAEHASMRDHFWSTRVERLRLLDDPGLRALDAIGILPADLSHAFQLVDENPDVEFVTATCDAPDHSAVRARIEALLQRAFALRPEMPHPTGWDELQSTVNWLWRQSRLAPWDDLANFFRAIETLTPGRVKITQYKWADDRAGKAAAKQLSEDWLDCINGPLAALLDRWREYRYPIVLRVLSEAAAAFRDQRRRHGTLVFSDLLTIAAELLRERPDARMSLGRRYQHLLVDEFQDTDPVQAEVCFLLASDPSEGTDWRTVNPRPGSLFVVGDPKQSIYRFRRADIETYEFVKQRVAASGELLSLTHNFRSTKPIETFVNAQFSGVFRGSDHADSTQAAFAPMRTSRAALETDVVQRYVVHPAKRNNAATAQADASALASWIAARIATGDRTARDFMVLTGRRHELRVIAAELAARHVAVDVSGAELEMELELHELIVVLQALADPQNPVAIVAALEGIFFGCNHEELFAARERGARFVLSEPPSDVIPEPVRGALLQLRAWWLATHREPSAIVTDRILSTTGMLAWAAGCELGDRRAGLLLQFVDSLRDGAMPGTGDGSMRGVIERLESLLTSEEREPSLRPGRSDAVRLMNVHRAKGLEAPVVVLAAPVPLSEHEPVLAIRRHGAASSARVGGMLIRSADHSARTLAQPLDWAAMSAREAALEQEEASRILYVACTRAAHELVVSCVSPSGDGSRWSPLMGSLDTHATTLAITTTVAPGRAVMERTAASVRAEIAVLDERRRAASAPSYDVRSVTDLAKRDFPGYDAADGAPAARAVSPGMAWGRAVHAMLERMGRGYAGDDLELAIRAIADREWALESPVARVERVRELLALAARVKRTAIWTRVSACERRHVEWPVAHLTSDASGAPTLVEGIVDLAAFDGTRWLVVDWKSDDVPDEKWASRLPSYENQVGQYAAMIAAQTGVPADGVVVRLARLEE